MYKTTPHTTQTFATLCIFCIRVSVLLLMDLWDLPPRSCKSFIFWNKCTNSIWISWISAITDDLTHLGHLRFHERFTTIIQLVQWFSTGDLPSANMLDVSSDNFKPSRWQTVRFSITCVYWSHILTKHLWKRFVFLWFRWHVCWSTLWTLLI